MIVGFVEKWILQKSGWLLVGASGTLPGEIADLAIAVEKLSGYRQTTIEEVKNG